jgi:hypothetical protein
VTHRPPWALSWITHGREEALADALTQRGVRARALALVGYEGEEAGWAGAITRGGPVRAARPRRGRGSG